MYLMVFAPPYCPASCGTFFVGRRDPFTPVARLGSANVFPHRAVDLINIGSAKELNMRFQVSYKGLQQYVGSLLCATSYLEEQWGSVVRAYELGVKLVLVSD